ncbi:recombinase family protein [Emticicia oligotrophica]|uniref:recombinase family protein n=1 Tax=Emticicia oligotrophica TaxID=312279 RepID=UPI00273B5E11|nr:recombinase family protein [Emticicia oligotrophica]
MKYVAYYRVSTKKQGMSGLGLDAQKQTANSFLKEGDLIVKEFLEIESGKKNQREQLEEAIKFARNSKCTLLVAKLDRLSRNVSFIFTLRDSGVDFVCADIPDANTLTIGIFATIAQHEREIISRRTKDALKAKKQHGFKLGSPQNLTDYSRTQSTKSIKENTLNNEQWKIALLHIRLQIYELKNRGEKVTYLGLSRHLNENCIETRNFCRFHAEQVKRIMIRNGISK